MIQKASRLRTGEYNTRVVAACRKAVKSNNTQSLFKIIKLGYSGATPATVSSP
jgi:Bardet-Biedl syndrome 2 protein